MKELAYRYYCEGWGCGQSIIKAADEYNASHGTNYSYGEFVAYIMPEEEL